MPFERLFERNFAGFEAVVCPSSSCVHHVRRKSGIAPEITDRTYELVEFLHDIAGVETLPQARFAHRVALHNSCTALRGLGHQPAPECQVPFFSKTRALLARVQGLELVETERADECCGFGGTFAVTEAAVSARMGHDKISRLQASGAEFVVSADMSCLMHLGGCAARQAVKLGFVHIAQVLNS